MTYIKGLFDKLDLRDLYPHVRGNPKMIPCPAHDDRTPSLAVYRSNTHCHAGGCRLHETIKQHISRVFGCRTNEEFVSVASNLARLSPITSAPPPEPPPLDEEFVLRCHHRLMLDDGGITWLRERYGLSIETLRRAGLGHNGDSAFTLPIRDLSGAEVSLKFRRDDRKGTDGIKYYSLKGYGQTRLFIPPTLTSVRTNVPALSLPEALWSSVLPDSAIPYGKTAVALTEGEMDALSASQIGIPSVSFTSGCKSVISNPSLLSVLAGTKVSVAYDMDEAGQESGSAVTALLNGLGIPAKRVTWNPSLGKDISELVRSGLSKSDIRAAWSFT